MTKTAAVKTTDVDKVRKTLSIAFAGDASCRYITNKFQNRTEENPLTDEELYDAYASLCKKYMAKGGFLLEANDYDGVAVVVPPLDASAGEAALTTDPAFNRDYIEAVEKYKKLLGLGTKTKYFYLFMIGKNLNQPEIRGSARAILEYLKQEADKQDAAVILEAINDKAKKVYEYFGFIDYGTINYGPKQEFEANFMAYHKNGKFSSGNL